MDVKIEKKENQTVITVVGRMDTVCAENFRQQLGDLTDVESTHVVVDCTDLEYISSSGLRVFISLMKKARKNGGEVKLQHLNDNVKEVIDVTGFSALFEL